jgi:predicted Zn-dependent protease
MPRQSSNGSEKRQVQTQTFPSTWVESLYCVTTWIRQLPPLMTHPPFSDTPYCLGSAYLKKGDLPEAENWLKMAATENPRDPRIPDHLARLYQKQGRREEAEKQFRLSAQLREHDHEAFEQAVACSRELEAKSGSDATSVCQQIFDSNDPDKLRRLGLLYL